MAGARKGQPSKRSKRGPEEDRAKRLDEDRAKPKPRTTDSEITEGLTDSEAARLHRFVPRLRGWQ